MLEYFSVLVRDDEISRGYRYVLYKDRTSTGIIVSRNDTKFREETAAVVDCGVGLELFRAHNPR